MLTCTDIETTACEARADAIKATDEGGNRTIRTTAIEVRQRAGHDRTGHTYCWERRAPYDVVAPWVGKLSAGCIRGDDDHADP